MDVQVNKLTPSDHRTCNSRSSHEPENMSLLLSSSIPREGCQSRNVLNDLHEVQLQRSRRLYKPFSCPLKREEKHVFGVDRYLIGESVSSDAFRNQQVPNGHQGIINTRNRHNKLHITRKQHKYDQLLLQRSRTFELQSNQDCQNQYNQQIEQLNLDIDTLIEEERHLDIVSDPGYDACIEEYENELEDYELQQELEMVELMSQLELEESELVHS